MAPHRPFILLIVLATAAALAPAQSPARPTTVPAAQIARWLTGLGDLDPAVREQSEYELAGLSRADLPQLKRAIAATALDATLTPLLRDIVRHIYLIEQPYDSHPSGFLGVRMPKEQSGHEHDPRMEVVIESRLPGFDAFRKLKNGDGILDIEEQPLKQPPDRDEFITRIKEMRPGQVAHLKVLREGKVIRVAVRIAYRPADIARDLGDSADAFASNRAALADKYLAENFPDLRSEKDAPQK